MRDLNIQTIQAINAQTEVLKGIQKLIERFVTSVEQQTAYMQKLDEETEFLSQNVQYEDVEEIFDRELKCLRCQRDLDRLPSEDTETHITYMCQKCGTATRKKREDVSE